ncbi:hypothetical protein RAH32_11135 [Paracoccus sp. WLY502]|uniref:hypothetical protein n=1 Tax=Paracoccus yibinensis TaxID=3068891 RepID=UPI0027966BF3|nr:hypothetical protein [Paracoccus sp. WLY502]MDQ1900997.1 hypothetical protein [Paracoccus sp. WLY502]
MTTGIVGAALLAMTAVSAQADCAAELARLTEGGASGSASQGISKDGSLAPLEGASDAAATGSAATGAMSTDTATSDATATGAATAASASSDPAAAGAADTAEAAGMNSAAPDGSTSADTAATGMASTDTAASGTASTDTAAAGGEGIAKDGSHMPLEDASGQQAGVAMSGADAQAQQEGQPTAAEQAMGEQASTGHSAGAGDHSTRDAHIQAARDALAAGDEEACMKAVQAAQSM